MKSIFRFVTPIAMIAVVVVARPERAAAQGRHPAYLHALSDLRTARFHLQAPSGGMLRVEETEAIAHIDAAIGEIKKASIDDGKDLNDHLPVDAALDHPGRLHRARELLLKARQDIAKDEDNAFAQGLQQRAFLHIDKAIQATDNAIRVVASRS